jgi:8-oxo-dGTP pyrophosphatase MutT (NUDIX family)|tara:strand:- start:8707 stop:9288 length:582 start_codon:yes stop_codon:yes gene_type:complete
MYKIFVGDKPIILTTKVETETNFKNFLIDSVDINKVLSKLKKDKYDSVRLIGSKKELLLKKFLSLLPNVIAGGGKVYNKKGEILFIFRNGKWDLPKGKAELKETINETALREVEEETGVFGLSIVKPLEITYHIFKRMGQFYIKVTYWFKMYSDYEGELIPQEKEGITKAKWISETKLTKVLNNSYANIKLLL